jgi:AcrR family transcriptional regulator
VELASGRQTRKRGRGRRPPGSGTREAILDAARHQFGELGYRRTTIRSIGAEAGVDPRLLLHYFGSKQQLFMQTIELPIDPETVFDRLFEDGGGDVGSRAAEVLIDVLDEPAIRQAITGLIRAAVSEPEAAEAVRNVLMARILMPLARRVGGVRPDVRAGLLATQIVGLVMARHIVAIPPMATASREELVRAIGPVMEHYLRGDWVDVTGSKAADRAVGDGLRGDHEPG